MTQLNRHQPERPRMIEGIPLNYRTLPVIGDNFIVTSQYNMISAVRLYRGVRRGEIPNFVAISDLHNFIFPGNSHGLSKKTMGAVVIRTVRYNPRKLLGVSKKNGKPRVIYAFGHLLEFQYGLEWMICTWLRKFLNDTLALKGQHVVSGHSMMSDELDKIVEVDDIKFEEFYITNLWRFRMDEPDWSVIAQGMKEPPWSEGQAIVRSQPLKSYQ